MTAVWPTGSTTQPRITDSYGPRLGIEGARPFHYGVDIPMALGAPVYAAQAGEVVFSGTNGTLGVQVVVRTPAGIEFLYPHMERGSNIRLGAQVGRGQPVGKVGLTGLTDGPHVCYRTFIGSWRDDSAARNPVVLMADLNSSSSAGLDPTDILSSEEDTVRILTTPINGHNDDAGFYRWVIDPGAGTKRNISAEEYGWLQAAGYREIAGRQAPSVVAPYRQIN